MATLVIRPGAIGDCLLSFPAIQHLRPDEVWLPSSVCGLYSGAPTMSIAATGLDRLGIMDAPETLNLLRRFDRIESWYGANRMDFRNYAAQARLPIRFHTALPPERGEVHAVDFYLRQVSSPIGAAPQLPFRSAPRNSVVIHPFSGSPRKNWPLESYLAVADRLTGKVDIEWSAGPQEELSDATRFSSLPELAMWLSGARLYIGNDSGISHLAASLGVPVLALFTATSPAIWAPRGRVEVLSGLRLNVDEVIDTALTMLDANTRARAQGQS
jgi:heptosyltransferase III